MSIVQAGVLGVMGALLAVQFKNGKTEYGIYISVAISVFIFLSIVGQLEEIIDTIRQCGRSMRSAVISVWIPDICPRC